jgi:hypothetical protein
MRPTLVTSLLVSVTLWGCAQEAPPATSELFDRYAVTFGPPATSAEEALTVQTVFIGQVNAAKRSIDLAVEGFDDPLSAQAIIDASLRGVAVRVVGDEDRRGDAGFAKLQAAGIPMAFGDGQLPWAPSPGISMVRGSDDNRMSHNFMVVDGATVFGLHLAGHDSGIFTELTAHLNHHRLSGAANGRHGHAPEQERQQAAEQQTNDDVGIAEVERHRAQAVEVRSGYGGLGEVL